MKLAIVLVLVTTLQVGATPVFGQNVSLRLNQTEIKKVLKTIENDGYYRFLYNSDLKGLKTKVDFFVQDLNIDESLNRLFKGTTLTYKHVGSNLIVILSTNEEENLKNKVTGKITGENGEALPGASVLEKGTNNGTFTNNDGIYSITVDNNATLVISSLGYESAEIKIESRSVVDVKLKPSVKKVDEVVVIGYGTASKRDLTGSIAKVKGDVIASQPNVNPLASLQSKVAGLQIVNDATPGSSPDVRIRGTISIGTVKPVYIIDGIFSDNMDFVNASEIESVEVLKDPSSLAIFGIKGAAGAILVTTKKAKAGQININFNTAYGSKSLVDKIALANGNQFRSLLTAEATNRVADDPSAASLLNFVNNVGGPGMGAYTGNTDWIDAVTRKAKFSTTNIGIDGSTEKNRFHMGVGYNYDEGLVKHVKYDRININVNDEFKVSSKFKVGFGLIVSRENLPYHSGALENARRALPIIPSDTKRFYTRNPYGVDSGYYDLYATTPIIQNSETNPLATLENNWDKLIDQRMRYVGNAFVDYSITKELNLRATVYADLSNRERRQYTPLYNMYDPTLSGNQVFAKNSLTAVEQNAINTQAFQQDYIATYKKKFGEHSITATAGITTYYNKYTELYGTISQSVPDKSIIPNDKRFWYLSTGFGNTATLRATSAQRDYATFSGLARLLYNYKNKYYLTGSFRRDGASQINSEYSKKFQNFWALGAAWELTKEDFMKNVKVFDYLKLKASTGLLGNFNALGKDYPAYPTISSSASAVFGSSLVPVIMPDYLVDPNLHWETVNSTEIGIEADMLKRKLHVELDYYYKKTTNLLVLLRKSGVLPNLTNAGDIENKGVELTANYNQQISKDLSFTIGGNLTTYKNKVLYLKEPINSTISSSEQTASQGETGYPIGYFYGLVVDGIYQSYADILASPVTTINGGGAKPGDLKYKDLNGDGKIDDKDRTNIGNPTPDFTYGINAGLKYKDFDLSIDFAGSYGNEIYRVWGTSEQKNSVYNYPAYYTEGWTTGGSSNWVPVVNQFHLINRAPSTYGIEDGSYFRIRNINIGYTITKLPKQLHIKNARAFVTVQNLKTWKNNLGYSPEFAGNATFFGVDFGGAGSALPRITTIGLNINF